MRRLETCAGDPSPAQQTAGKEPAMAPMSRRAVLGTSLGLMAAAPLARPYIANAQAKTAVAWITQGFVRQEDEAFKKTAEDYMKASGNVLDYSIMPFLALNQKAVSALTSGEVPDLIFHDAPQVLLPQNAWDDKLEDVTDVVTAYESQLSATAKQCSTFYNSAMKKRSYFLCPIKQGATPFHIWSDLVEQAGFKMSDAPKTWNAFWDFFKQMQAPLRAKGGNLRRMYSLGLQVTTVGPNDGNNVFTHFVIANGGINFVTPDGKLHTEDPVVREAAIKSITYMTNAYKEGFVPPEALSWNDADDNNGFHQKLFLMDFDGTISTELAQYNNNRKAYDSETMTLGLPNGNDGKPMPCQVNAGGGFIPKGAKNVAVAKDFMKFFMQPTVMNENLKAGLGRWAPAIPQIAKDDPWWMDPADQHRSTYIKEAVIDPTTPVFEGYTPAWGSVCAEQVWGQAQADVIKNGMTPAAAIDKAFKRADQIFAKFKMG
jgi:multiple sugar transport system substrate-binding protein